MKVEDKLLGLFVRKRKWWRLTWKISMPGKKWKQTEWKIYVYSGKYYQLRSVSTKSITAKKINFNRFRSMKICRPFLIRIALIRTLLLFCNISVGFSINIKIVLHFVFVLAQFGLFWRGRVNSFVVYIFTVAFNWIFLISLIDMGGSVWPWLIRHWIVYIRKRWIGREHIVWTIHQQQQKYFL